ncbi:MAG: prolyl oligopeptidase family serine peptidase [Lysobacter sp.]
MPPKFRQIAIVLTALAATTGSLHAQEAPETSDPYIWLENVEGAKALDWVKARNTTAEGELTATPVFKQLEAQILAVLDSDAKIPGVSKIGDYYYNFWKDAQHVRGVWRRTTLAEFRKDQPQWETVIDLDALNRTEGAAWVWKRAECLAPQYRRCLIALSPGGSDADVTREFDLVTKTFVDDGFFRPQAKGRLSWIDEETVYAITDFGPGSSNKAGYSRFVKEWKRNTPMTSATTVFEGPADNAGYGLHASRDQTPGFVRDFILHYLDSRDTALYLRDDAGKLHKIDAPDTANKGVHREWLTIELREPWQVDGKTYSAGSLLAAKLDDHMAGKRVFDVLFEPTDRASLSATTWTRSHLVLNVLEDVKNRLSVLTPGPQGWTRNAFAGAPAMGNVAVRAVDDVDSDAVWIISTDFLTPTTLSLAQIGRAPEVLKTMPAFFDGSNGVVEQHFAASLDGTQIPYFVVRPRDMPQDGSTPTLMSGYGGFEISRLPSYSGAVGKGWLEKGGVYVLANIRGGGEYGPRWHQAALRSKRHKAYEDFAAVAQDLVARKITSARHLGIQGGSNGGLLMGNMLTQYPELFGAVVIQVPLLDMQRYHKLLAGASWMAEYGDPDKLEEWEFIKTFSPYHLFDADKSYPPTLFTTSTRDDRVHPGHARKMMAKMLDAGKDVRYYENIEGGHGGSANNQQAAHMSALAYTFLWNQLAD